MVGTKRADIDNTLCMTTAQKSHYPPGNHHDIHLAGTRVIIKVKGHQHLWLAGGYDLAIGHF